MIRLGLGAVVTAAGLVAVVWLGQDLRAAADRVPTAARVCEIAAEVADAVDLSSLRDQTVLPARAAELATLLGRSDIAPADRETSSALVGVLAADSATVEDLVAVLDPVFRRCRVGPEVT